MKIPSERFVLACFGFVLACFDRSGGIFCCAARFGALTRCLCCHAVFAFGLREPGLREPGLREPDLREPGLHKSGLRKSGMSDADSRKLSISARLRQVCGRFAAETQHIRDRHVCVRRFCSRHARIQHICGRRFCIQHVCIQHVRSRTGAGCCGRCECARTAETFKQQTVGIYPLPEQNPIGIAGTIANNIIPVPDIKRIRAIAFAAADDVAAVAANNTVISRIPVPPPLFFSALNR